MRREIIILAVLFIAGCDSNEQSSKEPYAILNIDDGRWELQSYGYETGEKHPVIEGTEYDMEIGVGNAPLDSNTLGSFDCNTFAADTVYSTNSNELTINNFFIVTDAVCELDGDENYEQQNSFIVNALTSAVEYEISGLLLIISAIDSAQLVFLNVSS